MAPRHSRMLGTALLAALVVALPVRSQPQLPPPEKLPEKIEVAPEPTELPEPGVKVLDKGPIHEAFAQPGADVRGKGITAPKAPPPPIPELPPDSKPDGDNVKWIPGYWMWDAEREDFIWISGFYRNAPPGREWSAGEWTKAKDGTYNYAPGFWRPTNMNSWRVDLPEPPKTVENGPNTPPNSEDGVWIPGVWEFRNGEYVWRAGYWAYPQGEMLWQPPQYLATGSGFSYVPGFWDYPFEDRGLLYAPVCFTQPLWQTRGWHYRPRFALGLGLGFGGWGRGGLFNSLFIGPGYNNYFYGNYGSPFGFGGGSWLGFGNPLWSPAFGFGSPLFGLGGFGGYSPWFATGRGFYNPNWRHYCWLNRNNTNYVTNVQNVYVNRALGGSRVNAAPVSVARSGVGGVGGVVNTAVRGATNAARIPAKSTPLVQPAGQVAKSINAAKVARTVANPAAVARASGGGNGVRVAPGGVTVAPKLNNPTVQGNPIHAGAAPKGNASVLPKGNAGVLPKGNAGVLPKGNASGVVTNPNGVRVQPGAGTNPQSPTGRLDRDLPRIDGGAKLDRPPVTIQNPKGGGNPGGTILPKGGGGVTVAPKGNVTLPKTQAPPVIRSQPNPAPVIRSQPNPAPPVIRSQPAPPVIRPSAPVNRPAPVIRPSLPAGGGVPRIGGGGGAPPVIRGGGGGGGGGGRPVGGGGGRPGGGGGKGGKR